MCTCVFKCVLVCLSVCVCVCVHACNRDKGIPIPISVCMMDMPELCDMLGVW